MRAKGFLLLTPFVIITLTSGCDNVAWGGIDFEVRAPERAPAGVRAGEGDGALSPRLDPLETGPLVYLVERSGEATASIVPLVELSPDGYAPLPDPAETPNLVERFPLERWEAGMEFVLLDQGVRAGTFIADGSVVEDASGCLVRPRGAGNVEVRPEAAAQDRFLALRKGDPASPLLPAPHPALVETAELRQRSSDLARVVLSEVGAPWPPTVPGIRRALSPLHLGDGRIGLAGSFIYDDDLVVGGSSPFAYSVFLVGEARDGTFTPLWWWYQRTDSDGKAFPHAVGAHDLRGVGSADVVLEVFGEEDRWWAVAGIEGGEWRILHQDACGTAPAVGVLGSGS